MAAGSMFDPAVIAAWPTPNYTNPERRQWMPEFAGILCGVATAMVAARLWLRVVKRQAGGLGLDDALLFCSWLALIWFTVIVIFSTEVYMINRHVWDIPFNRFVSASKFTWIAQLAFLVAGCCVKVSVLLFYRRIVGATFSRRWIAAVIAAIMFTVAYTLAFIFTLVLHCLPTEAYWEAFDPNYVIAYKCIDARAADLSFGVMTVFSDMYAVALPFIMTRNMTLPRGQKIGLGIIFALGMLVVAAGCVRTYWMHMSGNSSDVTWYIYNTFVWGQIELTLGIICASAPAMRALLRDHFNDHTSGPIHLDLFSRRISGPPGAKQNFQSRTQSIEILMSSDPGIKHSANSSVDQASVPESDVEMASPEPQEVSNHELIKNAADYESYNLQNMERYRQSLQAKRLTDRPINRTPKHIEGPWSSNEAFWMYDQIHKTNFI